MGFRDPTLLNPIPVKVKVRRQDNTLWDADSREPIGNISGDTVEGLEAQVSWRSAEIIVDEAGSVERMDGYLVFLRKDLKAKGIMIGEGDRILSIGEGDGFVEMTSYVWKIQRRAHFSSQGGWTLLKAWHKDKKPVIQR